MKKKTLAIGLVLLVGAFLSLSPDVTLQNGWDKTAHFVFYMIASMVLYIYTGAYSLAITSISATLYEYLQRFVPHRLSSIEDLIFSLLGGLFGAFVMAILNRRETN